MTQTLATQQLPESSEAERTAAYLKVLEASDDVEVALSAVAAAERAHTAAEERREAAIARYALLDTPESAAERLAIPLSAVRTAVRRMNESETAGRL